MFKILRWLFAIVATIVAILLLCGLCNYKHRGKEEEELEDYEFSECFTG
ncbi:hypothetical protein LJC64_02190 [Ruminococcaceae bacterium OttesenSCG-928-A11]|nr:hypothetical protein [Ruminococcaceae bacterium OttesenSCG-928-A11]